METPRLGPLELQNGYPTATTARKLYDELDLQRTTQSYLWALPAVGFKALYDAQAKTMGVRNGDVLLYRVFPEDPEAHSYEAAQLAERQRLVLLQEGVSFCFETVYSHPSKIDFIAQAKALGYQIIMVWIHLESPALNQARIASRVREGGHDVPAEKVRSPIPRLLHQVRASIPLVDVQRIYDNSSAQDPFRPVLTLRSLQKNRAAR